MMKHMHMLHRNAVGFYLEYVFRHLNIFCAIFCNTLVSKLLAPPQLIFVDIILGVDQYISVNGLNERHFVNGNFKVNFYNGLNFKINYYVQLFISTLAFGKSS